MFFRTSVVLAFALAGHRPMFLGESCSVSWVQADEYAGKVYQECTDYLKTKFSDMSMKKCCNLFSNHHQHHEVNAHRVECEFPSTGEELKCENSECMLNKHGLLSSNGKVDYQRAEEYYEVFSKKNPQSKAMVDRVKELCSEKNVKLLSNTDCPAFDYQACKTFIGLSHCPDFNKESKDCASLAEKANTCSTAIENLVGKI